jgi:hypothetical protein
MISLQQVVNVAVEGFTDEIVVRRILDFVGLQCGLVRGKNGKASLLKQLGKYNQAAQYAKWLVVIDLDNDANCAPDYIQQLLPNPSTGMLLRIAVQEIEAWLLADRERLATFLGISIKHVPNEPDLETDPKVTLINLARRSRKTKLRDDIVPRQKNSHPIGPGYPGRILEFVEYSASRWRPDAAQENSDSLKRAITALQSWTMIES